VERTSRVNTKKKPKMPAKIKTHFTIKLKQNVARQRSTLLQKSAVWIFWRINFKSWMIVPRLHCALEAKTYFESSFIWRLPTYRTNKNG
jgi:glucose dehydrogenase